MAEINRFKVISQMTRAEILNLVEELPIQELKGLIVVENKQSLVSIIEKIYDKTELQDILYRSNINVNGLAPKTIKTHPLRVKKIDPDARFLKEMSAGK
jgi:uncharacterized protein YkvS